MVNPLLGLERGAVYGPNFMVHVVLKDPARRLLPPTPPYKGFPNNVVVIICYTLNVNPMYNCSPGMQRYEPSVMILETNLPCLPTQDPDKLQRTLDEAFFRPHLGAGGFKGWGIVIDSMM